MIKCLALLPLLLGCHAFEPDGAAPMAPPAAYRMLWTQVEACSGLRGDFDRLRFFQVPGHSFRHDGRDVAGYWADNHHIYIAADWVASDFVVKHEMLHDLIGHAGHPFVPFASPCHLTWESA